MAVQDWFRNESWNDRIATQFEAKLKRARRKDEYLYIQAYTLADSHPSVCLALLERYFALGPSVRDAQAHVTRARAHLSLGHLPAAIQSYEDALEREGNSRQIITQAKLDLPYLVATRGLDTLFERALEILATAGSRLVFPVERYKYHASRAIILSVRGNSPAARTEARLALHSAAEQKSGFERHPSIGLVSGDSAAGLTMLRGLCDA